MNSEIQAKHQEVGCHLIPMTIRNWTQELPRTGWSSGDQMLTKMVQMMMNSPDPERIRSHELSKLRFHLKVSGKTEMAFASGDD